MVLSFPSSSLDAARKQLQRWEIDASRPLEQNIPKLEEQLAPIALNKYGVEEAILEHKRMRLLDERGFDRSFNCAEMGANLLLLFHAMGRDDARLLRYTPVSESPHFGAYVDGWLLDPLFSVADRVRLVQQGLYVPKRGEREARLYKQECSLLDADEMLRHINFINSPSGFFDYYGGGQRIRLTETPPQMTVWSVYSEDDWFLVRMTGVDGLLDAYTFQRSYWHENGKLTSRDKHLLHCDVEWLKPDEVFYLEIDGKLDDGESQYNFDAPVSKSRNLKAFSELAWDMCGQEWQEFLLKSERGLLDPLLDIAAAAEREIDTNPTRKTDYEYYCKEFIPYLWDLEDADLRQFLISYYHAECLRKRKHIGVHARGKFYEGNEENLKMYAQVRKRQFKHHVDALLGSDAHKLLLDDYLTAYRFKQDAEALVNSQENPFK